MCGPLKNFSALQSSKIYFYKELWTFWATRGQPRVNFANILYAAFLYESIFCVAFLTQENCLKGLFYNVIDYSCTRSRLCESLVFAAITCHLKFEFKSKRCVNWKIERVMKLFLTLNVLIVWCQAAYVCSTSDTTSIPKLSKVSRIFYQTRLAILNHQFFEQNARSLYLT